MDKVQIQVPASSANLGPGFDTLGLAYELFNVFTFEKTEAGYFFENVEEQYCNEDNPVVVAFEKGKAFLGIQAGGFKMTLDRCDVPVSRGLGSSSTLIIAGVLAANAFYDGKMTKEDMLKLTTEVEGHPDNVCAGLFGGLTMALQEDGRFIFTRKLPDKTLNFNLFIPDFHLSTEKARGVLPKTYSRTDSVYNIQHALLLWEGLQEGQEEKIQLGIGDRIHVPYRKELIPEYDLVEEAATKAGAFAVTISGAGPTLLAISKGKLQEDVLSAKMKQAKISWRMLNLTVCEEGASVK